MTFFGSESSNLYIETTRKTKLHENCIEAIPCLKGLINIIIYIEEHLLSYYIHRETTNIFISSTYFLPVAIRVSVSVGEDWLPY